MRNGHRLATSLLPRRLVIWAIALILLPCGVSGEMDGTSGLDDASGVAKAKGAEVSEEQDVTGNGGVLKTTLRAGSGDAPPTGVPVRVELKYEGRLHSGEVVDSSSSAQGSSARFQLGRGHVIRGLDAAAQAMSAGEHAEVRIRADYAYGVAGRPPAVPPHATLIYAVELLGFEAVDDCEAEAEGASATGELPALPLGGEGGAAGEGEESSQTIMVGGAPVKVDKLGPVVVSHDGSISRIANWAEMTEREQQNTMRLIGKRNQQRLAALRASGVAPVAPVAPASGVQ